MAITEDARTVNTTLRPLRDARRAPRPARALLRPRVLRVGEGTSLAEGVAGGVPVGGDPGAGRLRRVRDLRRLDHRRPPARPLGEGVPQRVPSPGDAAVQGHRSPPRRPDRVPVPRLALEPRRHQLVRVRRRGLRARVPGDRRPPPAGVPGRHVGRVRVDQHGSRRPPAARGAVSGLPAPRRGRRGGHARVVVEGDGGQRQLEDGPGGVPRGLPRDGHAPAAHVRPRRGLPRRQHRVHRVRERPRPVPVAVRPVAGRRGEGAGARRVPRPVAHALGGPGRDDARTRPAGVRGDAQQGPAGRGLPDRGDQGAVRLRRGRGHPAAHRARGHAALGRRDLPVPELLLPPAVRERARRTGCARTTTTPTGAGSRCGRSRCTPRGRSRGGRRSKVATPPTTPRTGASSRARTSATWCASSAACTRGASASPVSPPRWSRRSATCTWSSIATSRADVDVEQAARSGRPRRAESASTSSCSRGRPSSKPPGDTATTGRRSATARPSAPRATSRCRAATST